MDDSAGGFAPHPGRSAQPQAGGADDRRFFLAPDGTILAEDAGKPGLVSRNFADLWPKTAAETLSQARATALTGVAVAVDIAVPTAPLAWWQITFAPETGSDGLRLPLLRVTCRDITAERDSLYRRSRARRG